MDYKRILTVQDISCVGQCSMTVALPILSACGHETCILPTALLSTHTGGFGQPYIKHLTDSIDGIRKHWQRSGITFDAIYTGYLGSSEDVCRVLELIDTLLTPEGVCIVDPAMGDNGRLYSGFDAEYVRSMEMLCSRADILLPNLTEAFLLTGLPFREQPEEPEVRRLLQALPQKTVVLTGVGFTQEETGVAVREKGTVEYCFHQKLPGRYHGTGDIFASCFTGAYLRGKGAYASAAIAAEMTAQCVRTTLEKSAHWYGIRFEAVLPELIRRLEQEKKEC